MVQQLVSPVLAAVSSRSATEAGKVAVGMDKGQIRVVNKAGLEWVRS